MSRNALILEKQISSAASAAPLQPVPHSGDFFDLIARLFRGRSAVAVVGAGPGARVDEACRGLAADLAASGSRVVIVQMAAVMRASALESTEECVPCGVPNVWLWPPAPADSVAFFPSPVAPSAESHWLASLRRDFDAVLLACPVAAATTSEMAALADAAVLVAEAGQTTRQQILRDQRALQLRGVKLAGCILMHRR